MTKFDYKKELPSLIVTIFNEALALKDFLTSLERQSLQPGEIIFVDAGSSDGTQELLKKFIKHSSVPSKLFIKKGNRSVGRNFAVKKSRGDCLAITDAGCILDKNWLKELWKKQEETYARVIAGYYRGLADSAFQEAVIPYFLVMPERLQESSFLPATRSMLIEKSLWQEIGGLEERLEYSEDYHLANKLKKKKVKIAFAREAIVYWLPAKNIFQFWQKIFGMAKNDVLASLLRFKVYLIFLRYLIFLTILIFFNNIYLIFSLIVLYLLWAIIKNLVYCKKSFFYLPLLQVTSDVAVMLGTVAGLIQSNFFNKS